MKSSGTIVGHLSQSNVATFQLCNFATSKNTRFRSCNTVARLLRFFQILPSIWSNRPVGVKLRIGMLAAALLCAAPLVVAGRLKPNPDGLGTHQQLGLPPCTIRVMWGIRCPSCGMTTSWSYFARGQVMMSLRANIAGTLLAIIATSGAVILFSGFASGKMPGRGVLVLATWGMVLAWIVAIADWAWRLV